MNNQTGSLKLSILGMLVSILSMLKKGLFVREKLD